MSCPRLLILLALALAPRLIANEAPIELFYAVNQKVYRVDRFKDGLPDLHFETGKEAVPFPDRLRHFQWQVKGTLPLDPAWAAPMVDYRLKRVVPTYAERDVAPVIEVKLDLAAALEKQSWGEQANDGLLVAGWVVDGGVVEAFVTRIDAKPRYSEGARLVVPESDREGRAVLWLVRDGEPVRRESMDPWDNLFFDPHAEVDLGELVKARDAVGNSALHYAAAGGLDQLASRLLERKKALLRKENDDGMSPLRRAARCGRAAVVRLFEEAKASSTDNYSYYGILRDAAAGGFLDVLQAMATDKPSSASQKADYSSALSFALNYNYAESALHLLEMGGEFTIAKEDEPKLILEKFSNGFPELGFRLIRLLEVDPRLSDQGFNLLHAAAGYADADLLEKLVTLGCDVGQQARGGILPMDVAVGLGNVEAICWFVENGGRNPIDEGFVDPVFHAIKAGRLESVECLIDYGFDVNREVAKGVSPLMYAVYRGELEVARALAGAGGVWEIDHALTDLLVSRLLAADAADLVESLVNHGWSQERKVQDEIGLMEAAAFFDAKATAAALSERGWQAPAQPLPSIKEVDRKPQLAAPFHVDYPLPLQRKYGDREVLVEVCLTSQGRPALFNYQAGLESELRELVEAAVSRLVFEPAEAKGAPSPVVLTLKAPLTTQREDEAVFALQDVHEKPSYRYFAKPIYPFAMQTRRIGGEVVVQFVLSPEGEVLRPKVIRSSHEGFNRSAISAVKRSAWKPAKVNGQPVAVRVQMPITFAP